MDYPPLPPHAAHDRIGDECEACTEAFRRFVAEERRKAQRIPAWRARALNPSTARAADLTGYVRS